MFGTSENTYSKHDQKRTKFANPVKHKKIKGNIWEYVVGKKKEDQEGYLKVILVSIRRRRNNKKLVKKGKKTYQR